MKLFDVKLEMRYQQGKQDSRWWPRYYGVAGYTEGDAANYAAMQAKRQWPKHTTCFTVSVKEAA